MVFSFLKAIRPIGGWRGGRHVPLLAVLAGFLLASGLAAQGQGTLERLRAKGELVIGTDATYPPFEYIENGQLKGFDIDLGNEIGKELGIKVRWQPMAWNGIFGALETGKIDMIMSGVTITEERKKKGNAFSRPYFLSGQTIARRTGDQRIRGLQDLKDKIVSVQEETTGQYALQKIGVPDDHILKFDKLQDGLLDVRNGKSDAAVADMPALKTILRKGFPELELVGDVFVHENVGLVVRPGEPDLLEAVNRGLDTIITDGRYARIYEKWMEEPATPALLSELTRVRNEGSSVEALRKAAPRSGSALRLDWGLMREALPQLLAGARMTLAVTFLALILGVPLGLLIALARLSGLPPLKLVATVYVEVVRGTPLLMQIYVIYFVLPSLHINLSSLVSAVTALSLNAAAYISEIFRAGIESIEAGQMEAARSLGLDYAGAMRWVILPQTLRRVLPPLTNEAVALLKDSSLISVIALSELTRKGTELSANSGRPTTIYFAVALLYLAMTLPLTYLTRRLEARWQPVSRARQRLRKAKPLLASTGGQP